MAIVEVKVPQLSESVAEATMLQWKKKPGDVVAVDEILIEIETDKVVLEVPAPSAGHSAKGGEPDAHSSVSSSFRLPGDVNDFGHLPEELERFFPTILRSVRLVKSLHAARLSR